MTVFSFLPHAQIPAGALNTVGNPLPTQVTPSDLDIIDTSVTMPRFGGRMSAFKPSFARSNRGYAEGVNFATLNSAWDARLEKYYTDYYTIKKTVTKTKV